MSRNNPYTFEVKYNLSGSPDKAFVFANIHLFAQNAIDKFDAGYKEHGGSIMDKPCLYESMNELFDIMWYMSALKFKITHAIDSLEYINLIVDPPKQTTEIKRIIEFLKSL